MRIKGSAYCASKGVWYYGVKLHIESTRGIVELPIPERIFLTEASCHDLPALEQMNLQIEGSALFTNKAYTSSETRLDFVKKRKWLWLHLRKSQTVRENFC